MARYTVKDRIADAYVKLLKSGVSEASIIEITDAAEVGRVSFYRNFTDTDDILRYYIRRETDLWLSATEDNYITLTKVNLKPYIVFLLSHMYEYREIFDILFQRGKESLIEEEFDYRFFIRLQDVRNPWRIVYEVGGVYKLFVYWAKKGYRETPEEVADFIVT